MQLHKTSYVNTPPVCSNLTNCKPHLNKTVITHFPNGLKTVSLSSLYTALTAFTITIFNTDTSPSFFTYTTVSVSVIFTILRLYLYHSLLLLTILYVSVAVFTNASIMYLKQSSTQILLYLYLSSQTPLYLYYSSLHYISLLYLTPLYLYHHCICVFVAGKLLTVEWRCGG